jgi:hypothetical protein
MQPSADGETLRRMGLPPGPRYRSILRNLRHAWVDGDVASPEEETRYLQRLVEPRE